MIGMEYYSGNWFWLMPFAVMAMFCFLMMRRGTGCMSFMNSGHHGKSDRSENAKEIAGQRYATGEISRKEYDNIVNRLTQT